MENNFFEWDGKSPMWNTIAGNQLDDPVLDAANRPPSPTAPSCGLQRRGCHSTWQKPRRQKSASRLLHFPLPSLSASGGPSDSPQGRKPN